MTSAIMLLHSVYQGHIPVPSSLLSSLKDTADDVSLIYQRIQQIDDRVALNFGTFRQYQGIKWNHLRPKSTECASSLPFAVTTQKGDDINHNQFFDSYETSPTKSELIFFDARNGNEVPNGFDPFAFH